MTKERPTLTVKQWLASVPKERKAAIDAVREAVNAHLPPGYEARAFLGADTAGAGVIAHWLDNFGAAYSVPTATGAARGDTLVLDFPYPAGAFRDTFVHDRARDRWEMRLERTDGNGGWTLFAQYEARRR
jgi:hypothetical protein